MSATCARSDFNEEIPHHRDGTLLKKKKEQWAKERAEVDSWFPFGSPGGGAPNRKHETNSPVQLDKPDNRPSSCRSNGDSGRWSDSENVGLCKEGQEQDTRQPDFAYPYMAASTSSAASTVYIPSPSQVAEGNSYHGLSHIAAPGAPFVSPANGPIPVQFMCPPGAYGQAMPIPVELTHQPQSSAFSYIYPMRLIPAASIGCPASQGGADGPRPGMSSLSSSYTEHWANQLPYWGTDGVRKEDLSSPFEVAPMNYSTISGTQPLAVVRPMMIPVVPPSRSDRHFSPAHIPGMDDPVQKSLSESSTSLNSSYRRGADLEVRGRSALSEQVINEQIAEKQKAEARRLEEERRETRKKENEMKRMEEVERNKEVEEEKRKREAEEERERKEAAVFAAIEKAKLEAEKLRKARLYKHIFDDDEKSTELEHSILGFDDVGNHKILKQIESLERQKKYEMESFEKKTKIPAKKQPEYGKENEQHRRFSINDERPIRGATRNNRTFSDFTDEDEPLSFTRRGRQSLRVPTLSKPSPKQRSNSLERRLSESAETQKPGVRRPSLNCAIPVRLQRRIPPPSARSRSSSVHENSLDFPKYSQVNDQVRTVVLRSQSPSFEPAEKRFEAPRENKRETFEQRCDVPVSAISLDERIVCEIAELKPISTFLSRPSTARRSSHDALSFLSDIPTSDEKRMSSKRRNLQSVEDPFAQNPLFQPVATRCRRSRVPMETSNALCPSPSSSSNSSALASQETSSSPIPSVKISSEESFESQPKTFEKSPVERPQVLSNGNSPTKTVTDGTSAAVFTPFRRRLANSNVLSRHREDELLSPEIKRKGECTQPSSLRSSLANLSVDGSDDGRLSPVSPLLQRFNSKTSQYRSLNLKKTSERNQQILERLAQIRSRLPQTQTEKDACRKMFVTRSPRPMPNHETPRKPFESVSAV